MNTSTTPLSKAQQKALSAELRHVLGGCTCDIDSGCIWWEKIVDDKDPVEKQIKIILALFRKYARMDTSAVITTSAGRK
jgi:hypothetical protein